MLKNAVFSRLTESGVGRTCMFNRRLQLFVHVASGIGTPKCTIREGPVASDSACLVPLASNVLTGCADDIDKLGFPDTEVSAVG
eukprot:1112052-Pyramimonas_sp.AAC.1